MANFFIHIIIYNNINWLIREGTAPLRTELQLWGHLCFGCLTFLRLLIKMLLIFWAVKADSELSPWTLSLLFPDACCDCFLCPFRDLGFLFFSIRGWRTPQECRGLGITPSPSLLFTQAYASLWVLVLEWSLHGARIDTISLGRSVLFLPFSNLVRVRKTEAVTFQCHLVS